MRLFIIIFILLTNLNADNYSIILKINSFVNNTIKYKSDEQNYGLKDYWAKPNEVLKKKSGDCEDIAILKYSLLIKNGIKRENIKIYFTIVKNQGHVFLEVIDSNRVYYLDNISNNIMINIHVRKLDIFVQSNKFSKLFEIATKDI